MNAVQPVSTAMASATFVTCCLFERCDPSSGEDSTTTQYCDWTGCKAFMMNKVLFSALPEQVSHAWSTAYLTPIHKALAKRRYPSLWLDFALVLRPMQLWCELHSKS
jgi:hypothetical protein